MNVDSYITTINKKKNPLIQVTRFVLLFSKKFHVRAVNQNKNNLITVVCPLPHQGQIKRTKIINSVKD